MCTLLDCVCGDACLMCGATGLQLRLVVPLSAFCECVAGLAAPVYTQALSVCMTDDVSM